METLVGYTGPSAGRTVLKLIDQPRFTGMCRAMAVRELDACRRHEAAQQLALAHNVAVLTRLDELRLALERQQTPQQIQHQGRPALLPRTKAQAWPLLLPGDTPEHRAAVREDSNLRTGLQASDGTGDVCTSSPPAQVSQDQALPSPASKQQPPSAATLPPNVTPEQQEAPRRRPGPGRKRKVAPNDNLKESKRAYTRKSPPSTDS